MQTVVWQMQQAINQVELKKAAHCLNDGEQIAFPTETVYGLGADATNDKAVEGIFKAKGRPSDNPLIVHIATREQLDQLAKVNYKLEQHIMDKFWPGPLTIILPVKQGTLSNFVTAGLDTVGIRMPDHEIALALIAESGKPIAAPSANRSGRPSPTQAKHVYEDLQGKIAGIIDGGMTGVGLESTVVLVENESTIRILRPGGITKEMLVNAFPKVLVLVEKDDAPQEAPRSPGMKYTHYAPKGSLSIVTGPIANVSAYINERIAECESHKKVGVLTFDEHIGLYHEAAICISLGSHSQLSEASSRLYDALRQFDHYEVDVIWSEATSKEGLGYALMNRLVKAAGYRIIEVN